MKKSRERLGTDDLRVIRAVLPEGLEEMAAREAAFDLVFIDPPYGAAGLGEVLAAVSAVVVDGGEIVLEHSSRHPPPAAAARLRPRQTRRYGDCALTFYA